MQQQAQEQTTANTPHPEVHVNQVEAKEDVAPQPHSLHSLPSSANAPAQAAAVVNEQPEIPERVRNSIKAGIETRQTDHILECIEIGFFSLETVIAIAEEEKATEEAFLQKLIAMRPQPALAPSLAELVTHEPAANNYNQVRTYFAERSLEEIAAIPGAVAIAMEIGNFELAKKLVENQHAPADYAVRFECYRGMRTPIEIAVTKGSHDMVTCFLDQGANFDFALRFALDAGQWDVVRTILTHRSMPAQLNRLSEANHHTLLDDAYTAGLTDLFIQFFLSNRCSQETRDQLFTRVSENFPSQNLMMPLLLNALNRIISGDPPQALIELTHNGLEITPQIIKLILLFKPSDEAASRYFHHRERTLSTLIELWFKQEKSKAPCDWDKIMQDIEFLEESLLGNIPGPNVDHVQKQLEQMKEIAEHQDEEKDAAPPPAPHGQQPLAAAGRHANGYAHLSWADLLSAAMGAAVLAGEGQAHLLSHLLLGNMGLQRGPLHAPDAVDHRRAPLNRDPLPPVAIPHPAASLHEEKQPDAPARVAPAPAPAPIPAPPAAMPDPAAVAPPPIAPLPPAVPAVHQHEEKQVQDPQSRTLSDAVADGNFPEMQALIAQGADINEQTVRVIDGVEHLMSPVEVAAFYGRYRTLRDLLLTQPGVKIYDASKWAERMQRDEDWLKPAVLKLLQEAALKETKLSASLVDAIQNANVPKMNELLAQGVDINKKTVVTIEGAQYLLSPIEMAAHLGRLYMLQQLLARAGARIYDAYEASTHMRRNPGRKQEVLTTLKAALRAAALREENLVHAAEALIYAVKENDIPLFQEILAAKPLAMNTKIETMVGGIEGALQTASPLEVAASYSRLGMVNFFLMQNPEAEIDNAIDWAAGEDGEAIITRLQEHEIEKADRLYDAAAAAVALPDNDHKHEDQDDAVFSASSMPAAPGGPAPPGGPAFFEEDNDSSADDHKSEVPASNAPPADVPASASLVPAGPIPAPVFAGPPPAPVSPGSRNSGGFFAGGVPAAPAASAASVAQNPVVQAATHQNAASSNGY